MREAGSRPLLIRQQVSLVFSLSFDSIWYFVVEGKAAAMRFRCKYIEVSAMFNHRLDELLVGIIKQMRLKLLVKIFKKIKIENQRNKHHMKFMLNSRSTFSNKYSM